MRRAYWTADFAEANIVAGLLRANGIEASIFDAGMAQLNWMETLTIGGYRIMVADADFPGAQDLLRARQQGDMQIADADAPSSAEGDAHETIRNHPRQGVLLFLSWLNLDVFLLAGLGCVVAALVPHGLALPPQVLFIACLAIVAATLLLLLRWARRGDRGTSSASARQARGESFAALSRAVDAAETTTPRND